MALSTPTPQQVQASHLIAGLTGALTVHRLTKRIPVSTTKRLIVLALVAVAIAYWHRQSNSPMASLFSTNRGSAQS
jgi:uncharacterized membrane protein YfcA